MSYITSDGSATGFGEEPVRADTYWLRQPHHARVTFFFLVLHSPSQVCVGHSSPQRSLDYVTRHVKGFFTRENVFCEDRVRVCLGITRICRVNFLHALVHSMAGGFIYGYVVMLSLVVVVMLSALGKGSGKLSLVPAAHYDFGDQVDLIVVDDLTGDVYVAGDNVLYHLNSGLTLLQTDPSGPQQVVQNNNGKEDKSRVLAATVGKVGDGTLGEIPLVVIVFGVASNSSARHADVTLVRQVHYEPLAVTTFIPGDNDTGTVVSVFTHTRVVDDNGTQRLDETMIIYVLLSSGRFHIFRCSKSHDAPFKTTYLGPALMYSETPADSLTWQVKADIAITDEFFYFLSSTKIPRFQGFEPPRMIMSERGQMRLHGQDLDTGSRVAVILSPDKDIINGDNLTCNVLERNKTSILCELNTTSAHSGNNKRVYCYGITLTIDNARLEQRSGESFCRHPDPELTQVYPMFTFAREDRVGLTLAPVVFNGSTPLTLSVLPDPQFIIADLQNQKNQKCLPMGEQVTPLTVMVITEYRRFYVGCVNLTQMSNRKDNHLSLLLMVGGGALGGVLLLIIVVMCCVMYVKYQKRKFKETFRAQHSLTSSNFISSPVGSAENTYLSLVHLLNPQQDKKKEKDIYHSNLLIQRKNLTLGKVIGNGNFGCVLEGELHGKDHEEPLRVAVKTLLDPKVSVGDIMQFACDIASGMDYLSGLKFVHRDLAARNCMLDRELRVKVADFGLCRDIYEKGYYHSDNKKKLPIRWMAIESIEKGTYTSKSDVWSMGIVLWELTTRGTTPYPGVEGWDLLRYELMDRCWQENPIDRPSFKEMENELQGLTKTLDQPISPDAIYLTTLITFPECRRYRMDLLFEATLQPARRQSVSAVPMLNGPHNEDQPAAEMMADIVKDMAKERPRPTPKLAPKPAPRPKGTKQQSEAGVKDSKSETEEAAHSEPAIELRNISKTGRKTVRRSDGSYYVLET
ncbi:hypothetical protein C0Q70_15491 [Pomacea canaliculata]|uniref:Protein kinase domain-containing protein n=2 Tax=Pomacea canaliculata TaxID=400727 RepID=A0A2T7NV18_POMCA|nr:hypothetical protein C0Q70_15491 [Pomacea canaliculata]